MVKGKKLFNRIAACAMVAVLGAGAMSTQVSAADTTVTVEGDVNYVDMSKYTQVLLPTSSTLKFALDPQGLTGISGTSASAEELAANEGLIISNSEATIANYSYYPIKTTVKLYLTDTGKSTFVSSASGIDSDTTQKIYLTATPSSTKTTITTQEVDGVSTIAGTAGYTASSESVAVTSTAVGTADTMVFALAGADYNFTKTEEADGSVTYGAERNESGDYGAASFKIGGQLNKNADWSVYTADKPKTLKLNAVFSYETVTNDEYSYLTDANDGFVQEGTYNMIQNNDPSVTSTSLMYDVEKGGKLALTLGTGAAESTVKSVQFVKTTEKTKLSDGTSTTATATVAVSKPTVNSTNTILTLPAVAAVATEIEKVDVTDSACYDEATSTYIAIKYEDATYSYSVTYTLKVTFEDGTEVTDIPVTFIKTVAPTVTYTGSELVKKTSATANSAIAASNISVKLGNGGATSITSVVLNTSKTTATVSSVDDSKVTITNTAGSTPTIAIAASAFKYVSIDTASKIVYTVTFDSGDTVDLEIPVAAAS